MKIEGNLLIVEKIVFTPHKGGNIFGCMQEALELSTKYRTNVEFIFNDKSYFVDYKKLLEIVEGQYNQ